MRVSPEVGVAKLDDGHFGVDLRGVQPGVAEQLRDVVGGGVALDSIRRLFRLASLLPIMLFMPIMD